MKINGYYINLEHRKDRNKHFIDNIKKYDFFSEIKRYEAVYNKDCGAIGCVKSHINVLELCLQQNDNYYLIMEDDFSIFHEKNLRKFIDSFTNIKNKNWDVITLTPCGDTINCDTIKDYCRIKNNLATSGYIIKKDKINILLDSFKESLKLLIETGDVKRYILDRHWFKIQDKIKFYYFKELFGTQLNGFSDIKNDYTSNRDKLFINNDYKKLLINEYLINLINEPYDDINNFKLAYEYEELGQTGAALSYYLRCAEYTSNDDLSYECLLRLSKCLSKQGNREFKELTCLEHAISIRPDRPEAYYIMSLYHSFRGNWLKSYMYACIGLKCIDLLDNNENKLMKDIGYFDKYQLLFQKAYSGYNKGKLKESQMIYYDLLENYKLGDNLRNIIMKNLNYSKGFQKIPKIIHQTWEYKYDELNEDMKIYVDSWKTHNSNYEHILYDKNDRISFIRENFDDNVLNTYNKLKPGAFKCDLWRYCILYIYGGYYVDLDTLCLDSLDKLPSSNFLCSIDISWDENGSYQLANGFIGSNKGNPILKLCIDYIVDIVMNDSIKIILPIDISGPGCLGICMNRYLRNTEKSIFTQYGFTDNNNIFLLNFDKDTEYMGISNENIWILQNKNGNMSLKDAYGNECKKIKDYFDWGKIGHGLVVKKKLLNDLSVINKNLPELIVIDNFYKDPDSIRKRALDLEFLSEENHGAVGFRCERGRLLSDEAKDYFEKILGKKIKLGNNIGEWSYSTNGCFQWCNKDTRIVYHSDSQEYAGIVFLTPDAPVNCGTSIFRHKKYKIKDNSIWSKSDWSDGNIMNDPHLDKNLWEEVDRIGNIYNRLILFKSHNVHAVSEYFGETINDSRLFQLFFFDIE